MQEALRHRPRVQITWVNERAAGRRIERLAFSCGAVESTSPRSCGSREGIPTLLSRRALRHRSEFRNRVPLRHPLSGPFTRVRASALALAVASQ
jgi:hypothetical protein